MTPFGAMRANIPGMAFELGWSTGVCKKAVAAIIEQGIARIDEQASLIWFPNFMRYNRPESPNVIKSWAGAFEDLPECDLREDIFASLSNLAATLGEAYANAFQEAFAQGLAEDLPEGYQEGMVEAYREAYRKGFQEGFGKATPKAMPNQEQEQEQDIKDMNCLRNSCPEVSGDTSTPQQEQPSESPDPPLPVSRSHEQKHKPPAEPPEPALIELPIVGEKDGKGRPLKDATYAVTKAQAASLHELYPSVDIAQELRAMLGWLTADPKRRKTRSGINRFINAWLNKSQNRASAYASSANAAMRQMAAQQATPRASPKTFAELEEERYQRELAEARERDRLRKEQQEATPIQAKVIATGLKYQPQQELSA